MPNKVLQQPYLINLFLLHGTDSIQKNMTASNESNEDESNKIIIITIIVHTQGKLAKILC